MANSQHVLTLDIQNHTVGANGSNTSGYTNEEIYIVIQGIVDDQYNFLDLTTGVFKPMSTADNNTKLDYLGLPINFLYADYSMKLSDILNQGWLVNNKIVIPTPVVGGRAYISFQRPVFLHIDLSPDTGKSTPAEPADENKADPNYSTIWDKFEFTVTPNDEIPPIQSLWSNTTCVDFVGIPMSFQLTKLQNDQGPFGFDLSTANQADPISYIGDEMRNDAEFSVLLSDSRIYAPKVSDDKFGPSFGKDGNYMDNYISHCWQVYDNPSNAITLWNFVDVTVAENSSVGSDELGEGCKWTARGFVMKDVLVFSLISIETSAGVSLDLPSVKLFPIAKPSTYDALRQGGVFTKDNNLHTEVYTQAIDGDIKNQVSTALNRAVMHDKFEANGSWWADVSKFYLQNGLSDSNYRPNKYAMWMHQKSIAHLCYALAFDDKYSQNVNISTTIDTTESTLGVNLFYKKSAASTIKSWTPASNTPSLSVGIEADPINEGVAIIWFKTSSPLPDSVFLAYQSEVGQPTNAFPASKMVLNNDRFELRFIPGNFNNPFEFYFKYQPNGATAESLLPTDAITGGNVFCYG